MANPVAIPALSIEPPSRRAGAAESDSGRAALRPRSPYPRLVYDARSDPNLERLRQAETMREARARPRDTLRDESPVRLLDDESETLREAGRRKAPAGLSFVAQQIAQEGLAPGAFFENFKPAIAAYARAAAYGEATIARGAALGLLV